MLQQHTHKKNPSLLFFPYLPLSLAINLARGWRFYFHNRKICMAFVGHCLQQFCASGEPQRNYQQDHGAHLGLFCCHLSGILHR